MPREASPALDPRTDKRPCSQAPRPRRSTFPLHSWDPAPAGRLARADRLQDVLARPPEAPGATALRGLERQLAAHRCRRTARRADLEEFTAVYKGTLSRAIVSAALVRVRTRRVGEDAAQRVDDFRRRLRSLCNTGTDVSDDLVPEEPSAFFSAHGWPTEHAGPGMWHVSLSRLTDRHILRLGSLRRCR